MATTATASASTARATSGRPRSQGNVLRKWAPNGTLLGTFGHGNFNAQGCAVDARGDVWVAHSAGRPVHHGRPREEQRPIRRQRGRGRRAPPASPSTRTARSGRRTTTAAPCPASIRNAGPIGADGVTRVGAVDLTTVYLGGNPYNYSDMTGSTLTGAPADGHLVGRLRQRDRGRRVGPRPLDGERLRRRRRSTSPSPASEDGVTLRRGPGRRQRRRTPTSRTAATPRVTVTFRRASTGESPVLYDLSAWAPWTSRCPAARPTRARPSPRDPTSRSCSRRRATLQGAACDDALPAGSELDRRAGARSADRAP